MKFLMMLSLLSTLAFSTSCAHHSKGACCSKEKEDHACKKDCKDKKCKDKKDECDMSKENKSA